MTEREAQTVIEQIAPFLQIIIGIVVAIFVWLIKGLIQGLLTTIMDSLKDLNGKVVDHEKRLGIEEERSRVTNEQLNKIESGVTRLHARFDNIIDKKG